VAASRSVADLGPALIAAGLNVSGCLGVDRYDALVPAAWRAGALLASARTAVVLGAGGRAFFTAFRRSPEAAHPTDPVDQYTRRVAAALAEDLDGRAIFAFESRGGAYADFVALGRAAGLGSPSRLGLLLHPEYGPWLSLRAVVLTPRALDATGSLADFDPCAGCPAPCAAACHGLALRSERFDAAECEIAREREPSCHSRCDARRACVVGREHRYSEAAEAHHMAFVAGP
jgi:epoxyqueuosine reductase QueG